MDKEPKWTPGPWEYVPAPQPDIRAPNGKAICIFRTYYFADEAEPNARLIAAAPDLYAALVAASDLLKAFVGPDDALGQGVLEAVLAALNKANP